VKKLALFLSVLLIFSACARFVAQTKWDQVSFYEVPLEGGNRYFSYPVGANIADGHLKFDACDIRFGGAEQFDDELIYKVRSSGENKYEAWYDQNDLLLRYRVIISDFAFWAEDLSGGIAPCIDLIDFMADSFSEHPKYVNKRFSFGLDLPQLYKVTYLPDEAGIILNRQMQVEADEGVENYTAEIVILPFANLEKYPDLAAFVAAEYGDYSSEYVTYDDVAGFYIDEGVGKDAVKHFYAPFAEDGFIFEAYLKLPSQYYGVHKDEFVEMIKSLDLF